MIKRRLPKRGHPRRGTMFVLVLLAATIVATIGFASLQLLRIQGRAGTDSRDFMEARLLARSAVEVGMLKIRNEPYWRTKFGNGAWITNQAVGNGSFSLSASDPVDNNVAVGENHAVILTGSGKKGSSVYKTSVRLEVGPRTGSCLEVSMLSGRDITVTGATLTSDQTVAANDDFSAGSSSTIYANVEYADSISGGTYAQAQAQQSIRDLPNSSTLINEYTSRGTAIAYTSIPQWTQPELLTNTTFESNTNGWSAVGSCTLSRTLIPKSGFYSLRVTNRAAATSVAAQNLSPSNLALLQSGNSYSLNLPILCFVSSASRATLTITSTDSGTQTFSTPLVNILPSTWTNLSGTIVPTWSGTLTQATVSISSLVRNETFIDYYTDDPTLTDITYPKNAYVINRQLISPTSNPFGATNADGIYVINCSSKDIIVANCRIVGTLVFRQPGVNTSIQKSISWEPAIYNYPVLLTDDSINIELGSAGLSETACNTNFNPTGTPYPYVGGTTNSDTNDSYPSKINGLVYSAYDITFTGSPMISGVVLADRNINIQASSLVLNYQSVYLNDPPPGFTAGTVQMKVVPGTWQRAVN